MAFLLPHLALAPAQCGPTHSVPRRPAPRPSFSSFLSVVDDALNDFHHEAQRQARRQVRRRIFNPRFDLHEHEEGYEVEAEVPGFEQGNIDVEIIDEHTLRIKGNTEKKNERVSQESATEQATSASNPEQADVQQPKTGMIPEETETSSVKSHQATVEDDFEDLGAEISSTVSAASTPTTSSKDKEDVDRADPTSTEMSAQNLSSQKAPQQTQQREWLSERGHGSFERTFRFPSRIDGYNVRAQLKNGILYIAVPKAPTPEVRHITIQ